MDCIGHIQLFFFLPFLLYLIGNCTPLCGVGYIGSVRSRVALNLKRKNKACIRTTWLYSYSVKTFFLCEWKYGDVFIMPLIGPLLSTMCVSHYQICHYYLCLLCILYTQPLHYWMFHMKRGMKNH